MGLLRRARKEPKLPDLVPVPAIADLPPARLQAAARYLGTLDADGQRVVGQSLSARSSSRLSLSKEALDVVRIAGSFRIPVTALRGARTADHFAGKPVRSLLVVAWQHGEYDWETGFRLEELKSLKDGGAPPQVGEWVRTISKLARGNGRGNDLGNRPRHDRGEA